MRLGAMLLATAALLAAGCDDAELCEGDCPDISGVYSVRVLSVSGSCGFTALTVGPTLTLQQSQDGRRVFADLIDPLNKLQVLVEGDVTRFEDDDGGGFSGFSQMARQVGDDEPGELSRLWVRLSGSVQVTDGQRRLSASLTTTSLDAPNCTQQLYFTGDGPYVP